MSAEILRRVKAISVVRVLNKQIVISISSDGTIKTFSLASLENAVAGDQTMQIEALSSYDTKGTRLTCLTAVAVNDDRSTTAAASVRDEDSDSDASDSDEISGDEQEPEEIEGEEEQSEEEEEVEGDEEEAEWGGIDEE